MATNGELLRVVVEYLLPGASQALNIFNYLIDDGNPDDADVLADFLDWVENVWGVDWADLAQDVASIVGVTIDVVSAAGLVIRNIGGDSLAVPGGVGGEVGAAAISGYILAYTEFPKSRGSKYIPGLGEGNMTEGVLTTESLGDLVLLLDEYVATVVGVTAGARYTPGVVRRVQEEFAPFLIAGSVTNVPAYQRRRKPNSGS